CRIHALEIHLLGGGENIAARRIRILREAAGALEFENISAGIHGNGVDGNIVSEQKAQRVVEAPLIMTIVSAVGNEKNDFAAVASAIAKHFGGVVNGVVDVFGDAVGVRAHQRNIGGAAQGLAVDARWSGHDHGRSAGNARVEGLFLICTNLLELGKQGVIVRGEIHHQLWILIEAHERYFVIGTESGGDAVEAFLDLLGFFGGQIVIENHDGGNRERFIPKKADGLFDVVLEDAKVVLLQVRDKISVGILHRDGDKHVGGANDNFR